MLQWSGHRHAKAAPGWASPACFTQGFKGKRKRLVSKRAVLQTLCVAESIRGTGDRGWSASAWLDSRPEWIWNLTKSEWKSGQKASSNYFRLQNASQDNCRVSLWPRTTQAVFGQNLMRKAEGEVGAGMCTMGIHTVYDESREVLKQNCIPVTKIPTQHHPCFRKSDELTYSITLGGKLR